MRPVACLGEAIVDLICERWLGPSEEPGPFEAHHGGAPANVAALLARSGVPASLVGGLGDDRWGRWLRAGLEEEGVQTEWLAEVPGLESPIALVTFDLAGEPWFDVHGEDIGPAMKASAPLLDDAVEAGSALVIGANTMVGESERRVTREAIEIAHGKGRAVLIDPNHRPGRWREEETAAEYSRELVAGSDLVKANRAEAELLTGLGDPERAALALVEMGPSVAIVTDGAGEIVVEGEASGRFTPEPVEVVSPLGAGDAFMAGLVAGLARTEWDFGRVADLLPAASAEAGRACQAWGARP
ncbi:MAG: carbohydrate kinase family protein, partial [Solirubrobacterales bacterium]|jgi:sugar/nucleoside kinase (ribokinase family)